jgi:hypothetical protein
MPVAQLVRDEQLVASDLSLPFREHRNYIHSADIFQALTALGQSCLGQDAYVSSLVLRQQAVHQVRISFEPQAQSLGTFSVRGGGAELRGWLIETGTEVLVRVPYDETPAAAAVLGGRGFAWFERPTPGYTAFEQLLVLLKAAGGQGKREAWLCQINLRASMLEPMPLAVRLRQRLRRFFSFEIVQDGHSIGSACACLRS